VSNEAPSSGPPQLTRVAPNPLAASEATAIHFSIPRASRVQIRGYDVLGRLVRTFVDEDYAAGSHSLRWKPVDDGLGPGVYFLRMVARGTVTTRKVVVSQ
jgi:flagellar hook assembly protein FlgD